MRIERWKDELPIMVAAAPLPPLIGPLGTRTASMLLEGDS